MELIRVVKREEGIDNEVMSNIGGVKIESEHEIKVEKADEYNDEIPSTSRLGEVKLEPEHQIKVEKSDEYNDEIQSTLKLEVGLQPGFESKMNVKTEKTEDSDEGKSTHKWKTFVPTNRWLGTLPFGSVIKDSPFVPFKMPFVGTDLQPCPTESKFGIFKLIKAFPNVGLIVDLTDKLRTYSVSDLMAFGVEYVNIPMKLTRKTEIPADDQLKMFIDTCSKYSTKNCGKLIAVHDLLGNRESAYMICKVLENQGIGMEQAMVHFEIARGYPIFPGMVSVLAGRTKKWAPQTEEQKLKHKRKMKKARQQRKAARKTARQLKVKIKSET